ncbi:MAG: glycosyltransferase family 4 protein [Ignavibacteriales bacterium]
MNIAIDLTSIPKKKSGVGRYLYNLIDSLQKIDTENTYYLFIHDDDILGFNISNPNFKLIDVKSKYLRKVWLRLLWEQFILPGQLKKYKIDLLHSPHYTMPYFSKVKHVVTFHDMSFFIVPKVHNFVKRYLFRVYMWLSVRRAEAIISDSYATLEDIKSILTVKGANITVVPLGADERFFDSADVDRNLLKSYGIESEYFLFVGMIDARKNIVRMLKAYNSLPQEIKDKYKFVICGRKNWMYEEVFSYFKENNLEKDVIFTDFVRDEDLPNLYRGAKILLYVSIYEGFGLPLVEAMASGLPCITGNISSMKEVAGDAGIKVNPYKENEIKDAIIELINNRDMYNTLVEKGLVQAQKYTWSNCAVKTLEAYRAAGPQLEK